MISPPQLPTAQNTEIIKNLAGAVEARKPWVAALLAIIFGPVVGMCYLNRGRIAFVYFVISISLAGLAVLVAHADILSVHPRDNINITSLCLQVIGSIHCYHVARCRDCSELFRWYSRWYALIAIITLPILFALTFRTFCYETFDTPASSMSPNVNKGDYFFVKKFAYSTNTPARGDIIAFNAGNIVYLKRVIGLPGDRIQVKNGELWINNVLVPRKQIEDYQLPDESGNVALTQFIETLPEGKEIRVLEQTSIGLFDNTPAYDVPAQHYFVIGDNRDNSLDSRKHDKFGFIAQENIIGRASVIVWNDKEQKLKWELVH